MFEESMRKLPTAPLEAHGAMLRAIADYTNERLPWEPTGPDTTYVAVIRIDELTQLYAVPHNVITESQGATLAMADGTYLPVWLPDEDAPPGVLGDRVAVAGGDHATAALRVVSWLDGADDLIGRIEAADVEDLDWLPTVDDLTADDGIWSGYLAGSFNPNEMKDYELNVDMLDGRPVAFVRIVMESLEPA